jgi:hypothetical protein
LICRERSTANRRVGWGKTASAAAGAALFLAAISLAPADTITLGDGRQVTGTVKQITADQVAVEGQSPVSVTNILRVTFSSPDVIAYPSGIILTDGTTLCGALRGAKPDSFVFRSVTLGLMTIPSASVAIIYFGPPPAITGLKAPPQGAWRAVFKNGTTREGSLVSVSMLSAILRTPDGLEKIPLDGLACFVRALPVGKTTVTLRNADRFSRPASWTANGLTIKAGTLTFPVGLASLREVQWEKRGP